MVSSVGWFTYTWYLTRQPIATLNGYTIEYRNYYKIVTNTILGKTYCLVSGNQGVPEGCSTESVIQVPVQSFSIDKDSYGVVPFIELLGLQNNVTKTDTANMTSPCIKDGSADTSTNSPQLVFSSSSSFGASYVAFSGNDDRLAPLQVSCESCKEKKKHCAQWFAH